MAQKLDARSKEIPSARKALKLVRSAIREFQTCSGHKIGHDPRDKDLVSVGLRHDASRGVHGNTADIPASDFDLTGVNGPRATANRFVLKPSRRQARIEQRDQVRRMLRECHRQCS